MVAMRGPPALVWIVSNPTALFATVLLGNPATILHYATRRPLFPDQWISLRYPCSSPAGADCQCRRALTWASRPASHNGHQQRAKYILFGAFGLLQRTLDNIWLGQEVTTDQTEKQLRPATTSMNMSSVIGFLKPYFRPKCEPFSYPNDCYWHQQITRIQLEPKSCQHPDALQDDEKRH